MGLGAWVLVFAISNSNAANAGASIVDVAFHSREACVTAGTALVADAINRGARMLAWGCFYRG